jgi:hypothetical protein
MKRLTILLILTSVLVAACASTPEPVEQRAVTLKAMGEDADVPLYKEATGLLPEEVARLPSGTECTVLDTDSFDWDESETEALLYQVDCDGTVGWVGEESLTFAPDKE